MAHKFDSFDNAYAQLVIDWNAAYVKLEYMELNRDAAVSAWLDNNDHMAVYYLISALSNTILLLKYIPCFQYDDPYKSSLLESVYWANKDVEAAELTMDALLSTMLEADPSQVEYFVGLVDAYRQSIWNRPFNQELFAALARGFEIWP